MKNDPIILSIISFPNIQQVLERLEQLLVQIKKALSDYLERQRSLFPRFYFVGDDDLLDIIGNAKDVTKLQRHFRKLFAGVHSITISDDGRQVVACASAEGEVLTLQEPVSLENQKINEWLTKLEKQVSFTLASILANCYKDLVKMKGSFKSDDYLAWIDKYQAQLIVLAIQISWSERMDDALAADNATESLEDVLNNAKTTLSHLADTVLLYQPAIRRKKLEFAITEIVHQRDVTQDVSHF